MQAAMARGLTWAVRILLAIALIFAIAALNPAQIADQITWYFAAGVLAAQVPFFLGIYVQGLRHRALIGDVRVHSWTAFKAMLIAASLNYLVPGQAAEITKASYISARTGVPMDVGISATLLGRLLDLIAVSAAGVVAGLAVGGVGNIWLLGAAFVLLVAAVMVLPQMVNAVQAALRRTRWTRGADFFGRLAATVRSQSSPTRMLVGAGLSGLSWALFGLGLGLFLGLSSSLALGPAQITLLVAALAFGAAIPIFPGALGTYEAAAVLAMLQFGLTPEAAAVAAIGIRICNIICILPVGLFLATREGVGLRDLLHKRTEDRPAE
jgi:uncharacterized membrane protein YbhN (UPF0104 family)